jgi:hypothetical protein
MIHIQKTEIKECLKEALREIEAERLQAAEEEETAKEVYARLNPNDGTNQWLLDHKITFLKELREYLSNKNYPASLKLAKEMTDAYYKELGLTRSY